MIAEVKNNYYQPYIYGHVILFELSSKGFERIDWKLIHDAGCTCDDTDLPHHVATNEEISILLRQTKVFLQSLQVTPVIVTVSRSSLDEFCPANQVEFIQSQLVELLHSLVGGEDKLDIKNGYQELQQ